MPSSISPRYSRISAMLERIGRLRLACASD
jgi:hypothetical protein